MKKGEEGYIRGKVVAIALNDCRGRRFLGGDRCSSVDVQWCYFSVHGNDCFDFRDGGDLSDWGGDLDNGGSDDGGEGGRSLDGGFRECDWRWGRSCNDRSGFCHDDVGRRSGLDVGLGRFSVGRDSGAESLRPLGRETCSSLSELVFVLARNRSFSESVNMLEDLSKFRFLWGGPKSVPKSSAPTKRETYG